MFDYIVEHIKLVKKIDHVSAKDSLQHELGFTSLNFITMIVMVCDEYEIDIGDIPEDELLKVLTVDDVYSLLNAFRISP